MVAIIVKQLIRNFRKDKIHLFFNILGLSFGLTASILSLLYTQQVLDFDKFHEHKDRIYRYGVNMTIGSSSTSVQVGCNPGTGPIIKEAIPGIDEFVRTLELGNTRVIIDENVFSEPTLSWADNSIFKVFTFPLLLGDEKTALDRPNTIVLTKQLALKYFGTINVIGKVVKIENLGDFEITGVLKEIPTNSILSFSGLLSYVTIQSLTPGDYLISDFSSNMGSWLFFLFSKGFTTEDFNNEFKIWYDVYLAPVDNINYVAVVEPYENIYLHSVIWQEFAQNNRMVLTGFISFGLLLLILACANYISLASSRSVERAKEIGIRRISGASQGNLRRQLIFESIIMSYISMFPALILTEFLLNFTKVNDLIGIELSLNPFDNPILLSSIFLIPVIVGVLSGFYPAYLLLNMTTAKVIKAARGGTSGKFVLRRFFIVFQFTISIGALTLSLLMSNQVRRISAFNPGFTKENLLYITCHDQSIKTNFKIYRETIGNYPGVISTSFSNTSPGYEHVGFAWRWESEQGQMERHPAVIVRTDKDYFKTLGIEISNGSAFFKPMLSSDTINYTLVNETFVKRMGWKNPIGKLNSRGVTIGVVNDYYYGVKTDPLRPMFIVQYNEDQIPDLLNIRISEEDKEATMGYLKKEWERVVPEIPFEHAFAEDIVDNQYTSIKSQGAITNYLSLICLLISCFGLFSFSSHIANQRKKDFVLRKVYGASSFTIFNEFSVVILKSMAISLIPAYLLAWLVYVEWSKNFAYNPPVSIWVFSLTTFGMLFLTMITTAYHIFRVARTNPVDNLAYE